jgi:hypothetical protein
VEEGDVYLYMANVYRQRRDQAETMATYEKAIACYRARVEADPTDWEGWANRGQGCNILGGAHWEFNTEVVCLIKVYVIHQAAPLRSPCAPRPSLLQPEPFEERGRGNRCRCARRLAWRR